jgi:hypothetical protein
MTKKDTLSAGFKLPAKLPRAPVDEPQAEAFVEPKGTNGYDVTVNSQRAHAEPKGNQVDHVSLNSERAPEPQNQATGDSSNKGRPIARATVSKLRRDARGERVSFYLPPTLAEAVRMRCAKERRSMSDALTEAVNAWLGQSHTET